MCTFLSTNISPPRAQRICIRRTPEEPLGTLSENLPLHLLKLRGCEMMDKNYGDPLEKRRFWAENRHFSTAFPLE
jgi:hypothetical protein